MKKILIFIVICLSLNTFAVADKHIQNNNAAQHLQNVVTAYSDSLSLLKNRYVAWNYIGADTLSNPYYAPIFVGSTYLHAPVNNMFTADWEPKSLTRWKPAQLFSNSRHDEYRKDEINNALVNVYTTNPSLIKTLESQIQETSGIGETLDKTLDTNLRLADKVDNDNNFFPDIANPEDVEIVIRKPNFWKFSGNYSIQFTQNYVSDNWYQGGESNNAMMASTVLRLNYDNKQKVLFENTLEMKIGFQTSKSDEIHKFKTYSDLIRLTNKLGLMATKHWYYTASLQSWTQFYPGYKSNDKKTYSDFMSPFESIISLGMDYKLNTKKFNLSANLSPIAYDWKYVDRLYLATNYGIDEGDHSKGKLGSNITINYTWKIIPSVTWSARVYYFTDYKLTKAEWENTFQFTINKYLSTKLFLYPRFDDSANRDEDESYYQFKEWLSLGLALSF